MASSRTSLIYIGKKKMQEIIKEISQKTGLTKKEIAEEIDLSREGLFHVSNRTGKINPTNLELLKKLYKKELRKEINFQEEDSTANALADYDLEELIVEIKRRGGKVSFE